MGISRVPAEKLAIERLTTAISPYRVKVQKLTCHVRSGWIPHKPMSEMDATYAELAKRNSQLQITLRLILDHIDYTKGSCGMAEPVAGALPREILTKAHEALSR